jgi:quinoprotein dehydrogenase-associated probable ABC transporter substrate-binding protein
VLLLAPLACASDAPLRVCSAPSDLPFSNSQRQGFENTIAEWIAHDLGRKLEFVWVPQRVRYLEKRVKTGQCDLVTGITADSELLSPTKPYYRSSYMFVSERDRKLHVRTLHDEQLRSMRIGLHLIGDEMEYVPPARELIANGMLQNIVGYNIYGHGLEQNAPAALITAVEKGDIDLAVAWGPTAGYFAARAPVPLTLTPICQATAVTMFPVQFDISMGVRKGDAALLKDVNGVLTQRHRQIERLLRSYHVPLVRAATEACD